MGNNVSKAMQECKKSGSKRLTLDNCSLKDLPKNTFKEFPDLEYLSLNQNQLLHLPMNISTFKELEVLKIEENRMTSLPSSISSLIKLKEIDFVSNELREIPEDIEKLQKLTKVVFQNNRLKTVPEGIGNLPELKLLYLAENDITSLPSSIGNLSQLTILSLYENMLPEIPKEIGKLSSLTSLNVSSNKIAIIPPELGNLTDLVEFFIFNNKLTEIPNELGKLTALQILDVSENQIKIIPESIGECTELRQCNFAENELTEIPNSIGNCDQLEMLKFSHNKIAVLPTSFQELVDLKELHVEGNEIESLQSELDEVIENLLIFSTEGNPIHSKIGVPVISPGEFEEVVWVMLCAGGVFKKYNRKGKTVNRLVYLDHKTMRLQCRDAKRNRDERDSIPIDKLSEVHIGLKTATLKKYGKSFREDHYFSLVSPTVTLDLEANSPEVREEWVNMFKQTITYYKEHPVEYPEDSNPLSPRVTKKGPTRADDIGEVGKNKRMSILGGIATIGKKKKKRPSFETTSSSSLLDEPVSLSGPSTDDEESDSQSLDPSTTSPEASPRDEGASPEMARSSSKKRLKTKTKSKKNVRKEKRTKKSKLATEVTTEEDLKESGEIDKQPEPTTPKGKDTTPAKEESKEPEPKEKDAAPAKEESKEPEKEEPKEPEKEEPKQPEKEEPKQPEKKEEVVVASSPKEDQEERRIKHPEVEVKATKTPEVQAETKPASPAGPTRSKVAPKASILSRVSMFEQPKEEPAPVVKRSPARPVSMYKPAEPASPVASASPTRAVKPDVRPVSLAPGEVERPADIVEIKKTYGGQTSAGNVRNRLAMFETIEQKAQREAAILQGKRLEEQKAKDAAAAAAAAGKPAEDKQPSKDAETKAKEDADNKAKEEADKKAKEEDDRKAKEEADRKAKEEAERKAKEEADRKAKEEADRKAKEEADKKAKEEADRKAKEEADRKAKEEADRKAKEEADRKAKEEADKKAKEEAERKAKEEAERKAKEEEERKKLKTEEEKRAFEERTRKEREEREAKEEAERKAKEEADRKAKEEADRKAKEEADRKAKEEAERKAKEEAERKAKEEAERKAKEEADRKAKEEADRKAKEEADKKAKEEADRKAKEEAERKAKEEADRKAKEEADKKVKEAAERKAKEEADKKAKEAADKKAKEEADKKAKEEADKKAKEEADKKAKEEADKKAKEADKKTTEAVKAEEEEEGEDEGQEEGDDEESRTPKIIKRAGGVTGRRLPTRKGGGKLATEAANRLQEAEEKRKQQLEEIARRREENMKLLEEEEAKLAQLSPAERQALEEKEKEEEKRKEEEEYAERVAREEKEREIQKKMELEKQKVQAIQGALGSLKKAEARKRVEPSSRLIMLKGKRRVRVHLVEVSVKSMNQGDVFILDKKTNLYIWNGKKANRMEKAKAAELTLRFKNQERKGANIVRVEPGDTEEEFWKELGGTEADIRSAEDGGGDIEYERECDANVKLWRVERNEDGDGDEYSLSEVDTKRLSRETLATEGCFILDCKTELFVWVGKGSTSAMRSFTMNYAKENLLESRPDWTHFSRNVEGGEEILFREKFAEWPDIVPGTRGSSGGSSSGGGKQMVRRRSMLMGRIKKKEVKIDVNKLHTAVRTEQELLGDGTLGTIEAWIGVDGKLEEEKDLLDGHFYSAESYVILYTFHKGNAFRYHIYFWQGLDATKQDKGLTALLVKEIQVKVQKEKGAEPFQERVTPLKEPYQLLTIFKGKFIVHKGKKTDHMKSKDNHLYRIQSTIDAVYTRCTEIPANASLMNSRDTFVVQTSSKQYIWCGTGTSEEQKQRAIELAQHMQGTRSVKVMDEGSEDKKFWKLIGGKKTYANASFLKKKGWEPRFYYCTGAGNDFKVEPVWEVIQSDLDLTGAMIVDVIAEVYVWTGPSTPEETKKKAMETATEYVRAAFDGRLQNTPIYFVASGQESSAFISLFPSWSDKGNRGEGKMELVSDKLKDYDREYTWDELTAKDKPKGLDYKHLEKYLPDSVFEEKFGMTKEKFWSMPSWKRTQKKKKIGFF